MSDDTSKTNIVPFVPAPLPAKDEEISPEVEERLTKQMSETLLAMLAFSDENGQVISGLIRPGQFVPPYDEIARRILEYREKWKQAPGESHIDDIFDDILSNPKDSRYEDFTGILYSLLRMKDNGLHEEYAMTRVNEFVRLQHYRKVWTASAKILRQGGPEAPDKFTETVTEGLRFHPETLDLGLNMGEPAALEFLNQDTNDRITLGIEPFDRLGICPTKKEMFGFMGPRGAGKSMFCTHVSVEALLQHKKVVDCSLELSAIYKAQRVFQNMFAIAKHPDSHEQTELVLDSLNRVTGFKVSLAKPKMWLGNDNVAEFCRRKQRDEFSDFDFNDLRIKKFASGRLMVRELEAYLDLLDIRDHFRPDVLIVDYPGIMTLNPDRARFDLSRIFVDLRGLAEERNLAVLVPHQANRGGERAAIIKSHHTSESMGLFDTADVVVTYNATDAEKEHHLARLFASKVRNDRDKMTVLISQAYEYSQFVTHAARRPEDYWNMFKQIAPGETNEESDNSDYQEE